MRKHLLILSLFSFVLFAVMSCNHGDDGAFHPSRDSVSLLSNTSWLVFDYGSGSNKLVEKLYLLPQYGFDDTCYIYYGPDKKIVRTLQDLRVNSTTDRTKIPTFMIYSGGRLDRILQKHLVRPYNADFNNATYLETMGTIDPTIFIGYDSIGYDNRNRISLIYHIISNNSWFSLDDYEKISYNNPGTDPSGGGDSLISKIENFDFNPSSNTYTVQNTIYFNTYDLKRVNPFYQVLKEYGPMTSGLFLTMDIQPVQRGIRNLDRYISLNPHPLTNIGLPAGPGLVNTFAIINTYDEKGNLVKATNAGGTPGIIEYTYIAKKK